MSCGWARWRRRDTGRMESGWLAETCAFPWAALHAASRVATPAPSSWPPMGLAPQVDAAFPGALDLMEVELLSPVDPVSFRDFYAFEAHVRNARRNRGLEMVAEWYEAPVFYFSNVAGIVGPEAEVHFPPESHEWDFELEWAVVIGKEGASIPVHQAEDHIAGFTILNDWSARDLQRREMKVGLGPSKGKDFASSLGPCLVPPAALTPWRTADPTRGSRYDLLMVARVNGIEYSRGTTLSMNWTWAELIAHASRNTRLLPGDLLGSGTVGTGCITEFAPGTRPWLKSGDRVELEVQGLGVLRNRVA